MARLLFLQNIEYEFLGPMYISSMVKKSHACALAVGDTAGDFAGIIESFKPDVIGFSIMTGSHRWALGMAKALKSRYNVMTLFGGAHPTFFPEFIGEDGVDVICRGEGEEAVLDLLDALDAGKDPGGIANLYVKKNGLISRNPVRCLNKDLDEYPFPDRNLYDALGPGMDRSVRTILTSRGCYFHCTFCFEDSIRELYKDKGAHVRVRRIDKVVQELLELKNVHKVKTVYFCDDVFGINRKWLYEFLEVYKKEIGLDFICLVRADVMTGDERYAAKLKEAGCKSVFFGIESGSERLRNTVLNKQLKDKDIYEAARMLHAAGLPFRTYNIVGLPDETLEDAFNTIKMNIAIKADYPWCSIFSPYPRTALTLYAQEKGCLEKNFSPDDISGSFFIDSRLKLPDIRRIENLHKFFQTAVLWPWTLPLIRQLIKFPPNHIFRLWFGTIYFYVFLKSEKRSFLKTIGFALKSYRHLLKK
ncbi:MAG: radical SAM protein [Elusimicrobiota bacterium]|nr:radical SAM protein [Elusimicrobiota bacterium]